MRFIVVPFVMIFQLAPAVATGDCPIISKLVERTLPALRLFERENAKEDCSGVARADFNGDGREDFVAVLTERIAPRKYANGKDWYSGYVVVFLSSELPYAEHQAVILLGYDSAPRRYQVQAITQKSGKGATLAVVRRRYSRTLFRWSPTGFEVVEHSAD